MDMESNQVKRQDIREVRYMITDSCQYSCSHCAVNGYKQQGVTQIDTHKYGFNEGALVQNIHLIKKDELLTAEDYAFLSSVFHYYYNTYDFTLTGGEAFSHKEYQKVATLIKNTTCQSVVTTLTKGAPLFNLKEAKLAEFLKSTDRIIVSLDTLDSKEHAELNLPLKSSEIALGWLDKTLNVVQKLQNLGKKVILNTIILPTDLDGEKIGKIIDFAYSLNISCIKFIELDTPEVDSPYIEDYLNKEVNNGMLDKYEIIEKNPHYKSGVKKLFFASIRTKDGHILTIGTCRSTCSQEHRNLDDNPKKGCEIDRNGSITINTTGKIIPCTGIPKEGIDILPQVRNRDVNGLRGSILIALRKIELQTCPIQDSIVA